MIACRQVRCPRESNSTSSNPRSPVVHSFDTHLRMIARKKNAITTPPPQHPSATSPPLPTGKVPLRLFDPRFFCSSAYCIEPHKIFDAIGLQFQCGRCVCLAPPSSVFAPMGHAVHRYAIFNPLCVCMCVRGARTFVSLYALGVPAFFFVCALACLSVLVQACNSAGSGFDECRCAVPPPGNDSHSCTCLFLIRAVLGIHRLVQ